MSQQKYLIIGQGAIGLAVSNVLAQQGHVVTGMARHERSQYDIHNSVDFIRADALEITADQIGSFTHIAIIVTPDKHSVTEYQTTYLGIAEHIATLNTDLPNLQQVVFISSTGVYGQDNGEWIDDTVSPDMPARKASEFILQAEYVLQQAYTDRCIIIRPSGIYGIDRLMRVHKAMEGNQEPLPTQAWTNRIMDTDLVTIIANVLTQSDTSLLKPLYIATDYLPVTSFELMTWLSTQLGTAPPTINDTAKSIETNISQTYSDQSKNAQEIMSGKRLHSNIPRSWLKYPDWKIGYTEILKAIE